MHCYNKVEICGINTANLKVLSENKSAREFYKKMKFSEYIITEYIKIK